MSHIQMGREMGVVHQICQSHGDHLAVMDTLYVNNAPRPDDEEDTDDDQDDDDTMGFAVVDVVSFR
jgi:hypothetical protein